MLQVGRRWGMLPGPLYRRLTSLHTGRGWLVGTLLATVMETREQRTGWAERGGRKPWLAGPGGKRESWHCHSSWLSWHLPKGFPGMLAWRGKGSMAVLARLGAAV